MALFSSFRKQIDQWVAGGDEPEQTGTALLERPQPGSAEAENNPYSHGLEAIYSLENIDISTVRPIGKPLAESEEVSVVVASHPVEKEKEQLPEEFDLGREYRGWMESFRLDEPITVLSLSAMAEKGLAENGIQVLKDLVGADQQELLFAKGLGQGHLDEIQQKLQDYLGDSPLHHCSTIDTIGLLRCLFSGIKPKQAVLCLEPFGLDSLFSLSPAESVEIRHISDEQRKKQRKDVLMEITAEKRRRLLMEKLGDVADVFIRPWMRSRNGLATQAEIEERLSNVSEDSIMAEKVFKFFCEVYFEGNFCLRKMLSEVDEELFAADAKVRESYLAVVSRAKSYFYDVKVSYSLDELVRYVEQEFAKRWEGVPDGFTAKALRLASTFRVRKGKSGSLMVRSKGKTR